MVLAAMLFKKALGVKLHCRTIRNLLVENHRKTTKKADLAREMYDTILDAVALNKHYFPKVTKGTTKVQNLYAYATWGEYVTGDSGTELWIIGPKFREFAEKNGVKNSTLHLEELSQEGLVRKFSGGYTAKHKLGDTEPRCYCLRIP